MAKKKIRTTFGGRTIPGPKTKKKRTRGVAEFGVIPDPRTKAEILMDLDKTTDALTTAIDARTTLSKAGTELHQQIQNHEAVEDDLKEQLARMKQQRNQLLDAIEDFELADQDAVLKNQQRDVAYAILGDLHSEIGTERSNEMVQPIPRQRIDIHYNQGDNKWREHK